MGKLRFLLALWLAKLSVPALKITRHNGTDFPGSLALKLCPDFLRYVGKPGTIIAVTGTNGKTTVSNLLTDILEADGKKVLSNRSGSNITSGISTALLRGCDLLGRAKSYDMAVLEVDERASVRIFPYVKPDYAVVTNLTRDSIMRNAHPGYIADILTRSIPQTPYPAAWTEMYREGDGEASSAKIFSASFEAAVHGEACGTLQSDGRTFIRVACADGWIALGELQIAGKKRLAVRELLLGWRDVQQCRFRE